jgi:hypothetical protein
MARMKRVVNRYGKITLASLGGCLVSIGAFLIVLSSLTVTEVARADECQFGGSPMGVGWGCTAYEYGGQTTYYCCPSLNCLGSSCDNGCAAKSYNGHDPVQRCGNTGCGNGSQGSCETPCDCNPDETFDSNMQPITKCACGPNP